MGNLCDEELIRARDCCLSCLPKDSRLGRKDPERSVKLESCRAISGSDTFPGLLPQRYLGWAEGGDTGIAVLQSAKHLTAPVLRQDLASASVHRSASVASCEIFPFSSENWQQSWFGYLVSTRIAKPMEVKLSSDTCSDLAYISCGRRWLLLYKVRTS